jgi:hypothetical protein
MIGLLAQFQAAGTGPCAVATKLGATGTVISPRDAWSNDGRLYTSLYLHLQMLLFQYHPWSIASTSIILLLLIIASAWDM